MEAAKPTLVYYMRQAEEILARSQPAKLEKDTVRLDALRKMVRSLIDEAMAIVASVPDDAQYRVLLRASKQAKEAVWQGGTLSLFVMDYLQALPDLACNHVTAQLIEEMAECRCTLLQYINLFSQSAAQTVPAVAARLDAELCPPNKYVMLSSPALSRGSLVRFGTL